MLALVGKHMKCILAALPHWSTANTLKSTQWSLQIWYGNEFIDVQMLIMPVIVGTIANCVKPDELQQDFKYNCTIPSVPFVQFKPFFGVYISNLLSAVCSAYWTALHQQLQLHLQQQQQQHQRRRRQKNGLTKNHQTIERMRYWCGCMYKMCNCIETGNGVC